MFFFSLNYFYYEYDLHFLVYSPINQKRVKERDILLRQHFFKTQEIYTPGNVDKFLIALATVPGLTVDNYFTEEVSRNNNMALFLIIN